MSQQQSGDDEDGPTPEDNDGRDRAEANDDGEAQGITDDQLPEDLRPTEDNPLARHPDQTGDPEDEIGAQSADKGEDAPAEGGAPA